MSTWALVGAPNSGKTTLYNWLTGSHSKVVNYPGATVEYSVGSLRSALSEKFQGFSPYVIDTPGVYSLIPQSEDERVTHQVLFSEEEPHIQSVVLVADATQLSRHLLLAETLKATGYPFILVITMADLAKKQNIEIDIKALSSHLDSAVVLFDGVLGQGLDQLLTEMKKLSESGVVKKVEQPVLLNLVQQEELLRKVEVLASKIQKKPSNYHDVVAKSFSVDRYLMHPIWGFVFFFVLMTLLFSSIYWLAQPAMDLIDGSFGAWSEAVTKKIPGLFGDFLGTGLVAGIGGVVIFIPQIFILFMGIGILEASGYLARVAALINKPLSAVGLGGRSFVPLLSGFACAIPALMATRNITSKKEKLIAQMIVPFMACSARLPVFGLLIGFLFADSSPVLAGFTMAALYFFSLVVGAIAASLLSRFIPGEKKSRLLMELPAYRTPRFMIVIKQSLTKAKAFTLRAGPIILILSLVLWFGTTFPRPPAGVEMSPADIAAQSYAAKVGQAIEPIFKPMGVDWRVGFGLISAFAAREVFVSALAIIFHIEGDEDVQTQKLLDVMKTATFPDGSPIFTWATVIGLMIFFTIALQCISTFGVLKREAGAWKPAILQLVLSNLAAYVLAVIVVNILKAFGL